MEGELLAVLKAIRRKEPRTLDEIFRITKEICQRDINTMDAVFRSIDAVEFTLCDKLDHAIALAASERKDGE